MSEMEMKTEVEAEDLGGDLSDEALDRTEGAFCPTRHESLGMCGTAGRLMPWHAGS